jgi:hypothetical protein
MINYRPVSLLAVFPKVLEEAMHRRLSQQLHVNSILVTDAAFRLSESVFKSINQKMHVGGIICDLANAFDCVNHEVLLLTCISVEF